MKTQADLAREMGVSRVRITQVMNLLKLAPEVQERLLQLEDEKTVRLFSEHRLRPLTQTEDPDRQVRDFRKMLSQAQRVAGVGCRKGHGHLSPPAIRLS